MRPTPTAAPGIADIKLVDGEICARGPQMLVGYLHPEDETASFDDEGYFRTGDLARWVDDGYLVVTGRAKDIIIRNGENISPKEVEDLLVGHPGIAEIAVVGVPDERTGERACAVIVAADQRAPDLADLRDAADRRGAGQVQNARADRHLGRTAEERRGQGPEASDPSDADEGGLTCR